MTLDRHTNALRGDGRASRDRLPQRVLHGILAVAGRQLQNLQVFAGRDAGGVIAEQLIVSHAEVARGEQVGVILIVRKSAGLAD